MRSGPTRRDRNLRRRIALEAARLITESGLRDYGHAKRRAAANLGAFDEAVLPRNTEIEEALREHQRLFLADTQAAALRELRQTAREAMRFFVAYEPRLVGAVLDGTADSNSAVCLHLHTDCPDEVAIALSDRRIPFESHVRRIRLDEGRAHDAPVLRFAADGHELDVTVLPFDTLRQAPLDRVTGRPMQRAALAAVESLLSERDPLAPDAHQRADIST